MAENGPEKVLFIITKSNFGGAQRYVYDLATGLDRTRFEPVVAFGAAGADHPVPGLLSQMLVNAGIRTIFVSELTRDIDIRKDRAAYRALRTILERERPDIVHLNSSKAGGLGALAARMTGVRRIIFTSHGLAYDEDRGPAQKLLLYLATWITFSLSHAVICISRDTAERARNIPGMKEKVHLIYNGIDGFPLLSRDEARAALSTLLPSVPRDTIWIGTLSELTRNKGLSYLIEACSILRVHGKKISLLIVGDGDLRADLTAQAERAGMADSVFFFGFVPNARHYLKAFDIFTLTSVKEGLPYVLLEAAHAALPVIASDIPGIRDIVGDSSSGLLVPPRDRMALAAALNESIDKRLESQMRAQSLASRVGSDFSLQNMVEKTSALYAAL